jgi:hypothetical protein
VELPDRAEFKEKINHRWEAWSSPTTANHDRKLGELRAPLAWNFFKRAVRWRSMELLGKTEIKEKKKPPPGSFEPLSDGES